MGEETVELVWGTHIRDNAGHLAAHPSWRENHDCELIHFLCCRFALHTNDCVSWLRSDQLLHTICEDLECESAFWFGLFLFYH